MLNSYMIYAKSGQDNRNCPKKTPKMIAISVSDLFMTWELAIQIILPDCRSLIEALNGSPFDLIEWENHFVFRHV